jgi:hypothetical protein
MEGQQIIQRRDLVSLLSVSSSKQRFIILASLTFCSSVSITSLRWSARTCRFATAEAASRTLY